MGSWSVYCSLSRITITDGQECGVILLDKNKRHTGYDTYVPQALPIFGEYGDYGELTEIQDSAATRLLMKAYDIADLGDLEEAINSFMRCDVEEMEHPFPKEWKYMWVNKAVYDFMATYKPRIYGRVGDIDMGNIGWLQHIGFTKLDKKGKDERYNIVLEAKDDAGKKTTVNSDGTWLKEEIYTLNNLAKKTNIARFKDYNSYETQDLYPFMDKNWRIEKLMWIFGADRSYIFNLEYLDEDIDIEAENDFVKPLTELTDEQKESISKLQELTKKLKDKLGDRYKINPLIQLYISNIMEDELCALIANLITVKHNLHICSTSWEPYQMYITPQCGEHRAHAAILSAYHNINWAIVDENGPEDDEDDE